MTRARRRAVLGLAALLGATAASIACGNAYRAADDPGDGGSPDATASEDAAPAKASANDGGARPDAASSFDAAGLSRCEVALRGDSAPEDFFCTDFDDAVIGPDGVPSGWRSITNSPDGSIGLVDEAGVDASRALDVVGVLGNGNFGNTLVDVALSQTQEANTFLHYQLDFDFRLVASDLNSADLGLLVFTPASPSEQHGIGMYGSNPTTFARKDSSAFPMKVFPDSPPAQWHHARVALDRGPSDSDYVRTTTIDGMDVDGEPNGHPIAAGAPTELWLGVFAAGIVSGSGHAQFDNVVLRRRMK